MDTTRTRRRRPRATMTAALRAVAAVLVTMPLTWGLAASPAVAAPPAPAAPPVHADLQDSEADVGADKAGRGTTHHGTPDPHPSSIALYPSGKPTAREEWVVTCPENRPGNAANTICPTATLGCPPGSVRRALYRTPLDAAGKDAGPSQRVDTECLTDDQATPGTPTVPFPGFTEADLQRLPLPPGAPHVQPGTGYVLLNVPMNVYAVAPPATLPTEVIGIPVQVRVTAAAYTWTFGDGGTLGPTTQAGAPYPALTVTHTYTHAATAAITLTTTYSGEYSVAGGPWTPIDGTADVPSAPVPVTAVAAHPAMVADPLTGF